MESNHLHAILNKVGHHNLVTELVSRLSPSEISSLLLALNQQVTAQISPQDLLKAYTANRFVKPALLDPIKLKRVELAMLELAAQEGFTAVELSPASPLGSCSAMAKVDQNNVISSVRGVEIMADSTNMLALYAAHSIKNKSFDNRSNDIHLCSASRVTRAQQYKGGNAVPHFGLFSLVSSGKDTGSYRFEKDALAKHVRYYADYFGQHLGRTVQVILQRRRGYTDTQGFMDRIVDHLNEHVGSTRCVVNEELTTNEYYQGLNFKINVDGISIVDGGFVDWTRQLLGNKKERLLISGAGVDVQLMTNMID